MNCRKEFTHLKLKYANRLNQNKFLVYLPIYEYEQCEVSSFRKES